MYQIDNHKELALSAVIAYLLQYPEIYKLAEQSGDRAQKIEDIAWQLLYSLDYKTSNGIWLDYIGRRVGQTRLYSLKPTNAFTFGGISSEGFGEGTFQGVGSGTNVKLSRTDTSFRNAIKSKIIQNNTDTSLDELIESCKLLFNASIVNIIERYPAGIDSVRLYGSSLIETLDANLLVKSALPAGVSLRQVTFHKFYNIFKNNAFITYNEIIPSTDDFEITFNLMPDVLSTTENTAILSQNNTWGSGDIPIRCYYSPIDGIVFRSDPDYYNDNITGSTFYEDENGLKYADSDSDVFLTGGNIRINESNTVTIKREGNSWSLYVNKVLVDYETTEHSIANGDDIRLYLGTSNDMYYNSGSIYNLYLKNNTTNTVLINDPLKKTTIGINNGVRFI